MAEAGADGAPVDLAFRVLEAVDGAVRVLGNARQELVGRREGHGPARARGRVASTLRAASAGESMVYPRLVNR